MAFIDFVWHYKFIILFYAAIIAVIYFYRKKFEFQAKFIALYKTKMGIKLMKKIADRFPRTVRFLGYAGIVVGVLGILAILFFVFQGVYNLIFVPSAPATFSPIIPGVKIPGSPIFIPFWQGILALFIVIVVHEFSHGVVSKAHKVKVKSSGIVFFGPLIGAFVEPDEKVMKKKKDSVQHSIIAAGPFSNVILAVLVALFMAFVMSPALTGMVDYEGVRFESIQPGFPAEQAGVSAGAVYDTLNGEKFNNSEQFVALLSWVEPGETVVLANNSASHSIIAAESPTNPEQGYLGVMGISGEYDISDNVSEWWFSVFRWFYTLAELVFLLSLGLGLANLLPLGPIDGGQMTRIFLARVLGKEKGMKVFTEITKWLFIIIILLVFVPIFKAAFGF